MLKDYLTIIVTIKNRKNTLPRIFNYYKDFPCDVIYLDSSDNGVYNGSPEPHEYRYVPGENYCKKLYDCCSSIKTKYSVVVCDDDFLSPTGLEQCIDFLESNPSFVACLGQEASLLDSSIVLESLDYFVDSFYNFQSDCPKERVENSWTYFNGAWVGAVMRNETQINTHKFHLIHRPFNAIRIFDKTKTFLMAAEGNLARLPIFHCVRSEESKAESFLRSNKEWADSWRPNLTFNDYFIDPKVIDTSPLEKIINADRAFIENIHENLMNGDKKLNRHKEILKYNILPENCIIHMHNKKNDVRFMIKDDADLFGWNGKTTQGKIKALVDTIKTYEVIVSLGTGGDYCGTYVENIVKQQYPNIEVSHPYQYKKFINSKEKKKSEFELYPALRAENMEQLKKIIDFVERFSL